MKNILFFLILLYSVQWLMAQPINKNIGNNVSMPTPSATSLGKYVDLPVSIANGTPNIDIPIHTLQEGNLKLPISLSYHASGVRVTELSSWVGHGWSLNAGGMITRTVMGIEDEAETIGWLAVGHTIQHPFLGGTGIGSFQDVVGSSPDKDVEPDLFTFNFNGFSGKFIFDANKNIKLIPEQDIKIEAIFKPGSADPEIDGFVLITPDGTKYRFGTNGDNTQRGTVLTSEKTSHLVLGGSSTVPKNSSWYLQKMESFDGNNVINLEYTDRDNNDAYSYWYRKARSQSKTNDFTRNNGSPWFPSNFGSCSTQTTTGSGLFIEDYLANNIISASRLKSISTTTEKVTFDGLTARTDVGSNTIPPFNAQNNAKRLDAIQISNIANTGFCKKFELEYEDWTSTNTAPTGMDYNTHDPMGKKRFFLKKIREKHCGTQTNPIPLPYELDYEGTTSSLPHRCSNQIDYWGFYNGATQNDTHIGLNIPQQTYVSNLDNTTTVSVGGISNRDANDYSSKIGTLKQIKYPTAGTVDFTWEGNRADFKDYAKGISLFVPNVNAILPSTSPLTTDYNVGSFTTPEISNAGLSFFFLPLSGNFTITSATIKFHELVNGTVVGALVGEKTINNIVSGVRYDYLLNSFGSFDPTKSYRVAIAINGSGRVFLNVIRPVVTSNMLAAGIRIKKIEKKPIVGTNIVHNYTYVDDNNNSSGELLSVPKYSYYFSSPLVPNGQSEKYFFTEVPQYGLSDFDGRNVRYNQVIEETTGNGKKKYKFFNQNFFSIAPFLFPSLPANPNPESGKINIEKSIDANNNTLSEKIITPNKDRYDIPIAGIVYRFSAIGRCDFGSDIFVNVYPLKTYAYREKEVVEKLDNVETRTTYEYGTNHLLPIKTTTTNSDNKVTITEVKYSFDENSITHPIAKAQLKAYNILTPVETKKSINGVQIGGSKIDFAMINPTSGMPISGTLGFPRPYKFYEFEQCVCNETNYRLIGTVTKYTAKGQPESYKAEGWSPETYLWDATNKQIKEKSFLGHTTKYDYHPSTSLLSKITNIDGQFTTFQYDPLMRLKKTNGRFGNTTTPALTTEYTYSYGFNGTTPNNFVNTKTTISNSPTDIVLEQRSYFDGLGRHLQTLKGRYSGEVGNGDVAFEKTHYDAVGRVHSTLLPIHTGTNGTLEYTTGSQSYTLNTYEASPLNRISMTTSPLGHKSTVLYGTNTAADNVKLFRPDGISTSFYAENSLYKTETRDPNTNATATPNLKKGEVTATFKDKLGRTILVRKRYDTSPNPAIIEFIDTYYIYDDRGNLVFVLPPEANDGASPLAFKYTYNCRNQLIQKQVPDAGKTEFWYEANRDLLVATQDANGNLMLTEYDDYGRVTKTGLGSVPNINCTNATDVSIGVDDLDDPFIDPNPVIDPPVYVNSCACNVMPAAPSVIDVYTQNWYDGDGSKPIERGKLTKNKVKIHNFNKSVGSSGAKVFTSLYTTSENNYDVHGRITTITSTNPFGHTETKTNMYKNAGSDLIQNSTYDHVYQNATNNLQNRISNTMTYDNWTRNLQQTHQIDQNPAVVIAKNDYNHRGELIQKSLNYFAAATAPFDKAWQTIDYQYNAEGWLTKINNPWITTDLLTDACLANSRTCATCDDKLTTTAAAAAAISKIDIALNYNIAALNEGESPKGKVTIHSDFKLIDQEGASSLHSEESEFVIGEVAENDNTILSNQTKFSIDKIGLITAGTEDRAAAYFENTLRDELAKTSLKSEAQVEILREALPIFKAQLNTINLNTLPSVPPVQGYTTKDLFKEELYYGFSGSPTSTSRKAQYNGNISEVVWQVGSRAKQSYTYEYDRLNRVTKSKYEEINNTNTFVQNERFSETFTYDKRGNITGKIANGVLSQVSCYEVKQIDNLQYTYDYTKGNRLTKIQENATDANYKFKGFNPGTVPTSALYEYDANGNLKKDPYKGCTFTYNYLNLPEKITWSPAQYIEFIYDATGRKLRKIVTVSSVKTVFDYCDGIEYKNGAFAAIYHAEGRVVKEAGLYQYQYTLRDHLGNGRVYFTDKTNNNIIDDNDILQDESYYTFGGAIDYSNYTTTIDINKYQYNGKELNDEFNLNLSDYGARWYDAAIGRWTSVDPLTEKQESFSPYHYTYDNPVRYNDPDGREGEDCCPGLGAMSLS